MGNNNPANKVPTKVILSVVSYGVAVSGYLGTKFGTWNWFSFHPALMMLSFFSLTGAAALIKKRGGYTNTKLHGYLMALATVAAGFAFYVIYSNKIMLQKDHFTSWHSWWGLTALLAYLLLFVVGLFGLHPDFGAAKTNKLIRASHKYAARLATVIAWISMILAFNKLDDDPTHQLAFATPLVASAFIVLV
uniref:Cytochrome b561 domain-containing protein n=1 Tax=Aureoumbra lagunensis TaxID=44058 RepID=A0A7S3NL26_9STRA|mmetsp:Transcript_18199/g.27456  ORF Transcript_18199/g.27456 Transcript_18199/m.27456 type:complete len:191 (+) Transcript_18199:54-626(+)